MRVAVLLLAFIILPSAAFARIEYALQSAAVSCVSCHVSPVGGGLRTIAGRQFGMHGHEPTTNSLQEHFQVDFRAIGLVPEHSSDDQAGFGLMELLAAGQYGINRVGEIEPRVRIVATYNFGTFATGLRDTYLLWRSATGSPTHLLGLFPAPFGLVTDEHRTYVRVQSKTTHNDFYMGVLGARDFGSLHVDGVVANGMQNSAAEGQGRISQGLTAAGILNARWTPTSLPFLLGVSGNINERHGDVADPFAVSAYGAFALSRLFPNLPAAVWQVEGVYSRDWADGSLNPEMQRLFFSDASIEQLASDKASIGALSILQVPLLPKLQLLYKFDYLDLNQDVGDTTFTRHGIGFKYFAESYLTLQLRHEFADTTANVDRRQNLAAQDASWLLVHGWF